jgi:hypothetical protein
LDQKVFLLSIISFAITKLKAYSILSIGHIQIEGMWLILFKDEIVKY